MKLIIGMQPYFDPTRNMEDVLKQNRNGREPQKNENGRQPQFYFEKLE
jgi:hypothetical protein